MNTLTTLNPHGYSVGDCITIREWKPWYVRLWRWITRYKPPTLVVTGVTETTMTVEPK